ncbi:M48 family metalloprotease [Candidatus Laterigemmans baculatus]|uniref:M48 family metalloprotease n=1 Tax=Candidatus Laterigemmans baculatus TaxID=2770505 RepID=UPI0013D8EECE|nr:M48 family metalloprotease [Candidatus Laterigemmans baculatus]
MSETAPLEEPLAYHAAVRDYLQREEPEVWQWYALNRVRAEHAEANRFELLKKTYRVDRGSQSDLYRIADEVAGRVAPGVAVTVYHAQQPAGLNASLAYLPGEAHVVLHGPVAEKLNEAELRALFAHELGHVMLYERWEGELLIASQVLSAMTHDRRAAAAHFATARLFDLYTEVFCDRVALRVIGDPHDVVSMLVKISTGLDRVDPEGYLKQAEEILGRSPAAASEGLTHPEAYLRAHVLKLWQEQPAEAAQRLAELIEGQPPLDELDFIAQQRLHAWTRSLLDAFFEPAWARTDLLLSHGRLFFDDYQPPPLASASPKSAASDSRLGALQTPVAEAHASVQDYCCYVLLDFASADRELETAPLAHALDIAARLGLEKRMGEIAAKELRLRKKQLEQIAADRERLIADAAKLGTSP